MPKKDERKSPAWRQSPVAAAVKGVTKHTLRISALYKGKTAAFIEFEKPPS
jgi:hypothetical protein